MRQIIIQAIKRICFQYLRTCKDTIYKIRCCQKMQFAYHKDMGPQSIQVIQSLYLQDNISAILDVIQ